MLTRNSIMDSLEAGVCDVTFTKVDGSTRHMRCTLKSDLLPANSTEGRVATGRRTLTPSVIRVFDLDLDEWRSFRIDSIQSFSGADAGIEVTRVGGCVVMSEKDYDRLCAVLKNAASLGLV